MSDSPDIFYEEVERRFLVTDGTVVKGHDGNVIVQAYLFSKDGFVVRVRRTHLPDTKNTYREGISLLTAKGPRHDGKREEYEVQVSHDLAMQLIARATHKISKSRYQVVADEQLWDVDVFHGDNEGLIIAECETTDPSAIEIPVWCGVEITDDDRYNNESLAAIPFSSWGAGG